jgi:23S rRNA pseudouridine1911/1915/1917 synthase
MTQFTGENVRLTVPKEAAKQRLDLYLAGQLTQYSRSRLQQLIKGGFVRVNREAARPRQIVRTGDTVDLAAPAPVKSENAAQDIPLDILFEDNDLLVINKPAGLVVHPGAGHRDRTLVNALLHHCTNLSGIGGEERPGIVHRLDKDTSGCLIVATNDEAHRDLAAQFAGRTVDKVYLALVAGNLRSKTGSIDARIARHPVHRQRMTVGSTRGRTARTDYRVLKEGPAASLIECRIHSGRTHQIRVHLHQLGHPVLGDKLYAPKLARGFARQMLHAWKVAFDHPGTKERLEFEAAAPEDFEEAMERLELEK